MMYTSTRSSELKFTFQEIVLRGIPNDGGLFVPFKIPLFESSFFEQITEMDFHEMALAVATSFVREEDVPRETLKEIVEKAFNFPLPIIELFDNLSVMELFHGPTSAFKDFGAKFMAGIIEYFIKVTGQKLTILTATSGDTGGAVASAFHNISGVNVFILYPKGRISEFQEKQIAGLGDNIHPIQIDGNFDDCQHIVKSCFADVEFRNQVNLTSSNSVNFSRLIPQIIFYFEAYRQSRLIKKRNISCIIPSGNLGNLTGAVYAKKMGLPINEIVAATNENKVLPDYINDGLWFPAESIETVSNAMDVGNPSNIERIFYIYRSTWNNIKNDIHSSSINDRNTLTIIENIYKKYNYLLDPHTAVGMGNYFIETMIHSDTHYVLMATAHPFKFQKVIQTVLPDIVVSTNEYINFYKNISINKTVLQKDLQKLKGIIINTV